MNLSRRQFCQRAACLSALGGFAFARGLQGGDVPWLADVQQVPSPLPADAPQLTSLLIDDQGNEIRTLAAWKARRSQLRESWLRYLGSLALPPDRRPTLEVLAEDHDGGVHRQLVRYEIEPGVFTEAYLLRPSQVVGKVPAVAVFHSTVNHSILQPAGLGTDPEKAFGQKLAQRGMVAFCPRNFLWPDNRHIAADAETRRFQERHRTALGMAKMLDDAIVAVNILAGLPEVDAQRIGAVGHSLGAKEVLYLAAFDERIRATVSSEGGIGIQFSNWEAPWYLGRDIHQPEFRHDHHELLAMAAPRAFLLVGGDSADGERSWPFIAAALPVYRLFPGAPRVGLFNHHQGHSVPAASEQRIYEWLTAYL